MQGMITLEKDIRIISTTIADVITSSVAILVTDTKSAISTGNAGKD